MLCCQLAKPHGIKDRLNRSAHHQPTLYKLISPCALYPTISHTSHISFTPCTVQQHHHHVPYESSIKSKKKKKKIIILYNVSMNALVCLRLVYMQFTGLAPGKYFSLTPNNNGLGQSHCMPPILDASRNQRSPTPQPHRMSRPLIGSLHDCLPLQHNDRKWKPEPWHNFQRKRVSIY